MSVTEFVPGRVIGQKYGLLRLIGTGGMGSVFEAEHAWTHRRVAVKLLLPALSARPEIAQRFLQEAQSAARIGHPNIVDILDMGQEPDGALYMVQELLSGVDLGQRLTRAGALSVREAIDIAVPIIGALAAAHAVGVIHRDIKPGNIFLVEGPDGGVVPTLIDFGVAKLLGTDAGLLDPTRAGAVVGTPSHMAPEQIRGERNIDARADVWAVGVVLYQMLAGRLPFDDAAPHLVALRVVGERAPDVRLLAPRVDPSLSAVIQDALEPDRARRVADMASLFHRIAAAQPFASDDPERSLARRHRVALIPLIGGTRAPEQQTRVGSLARPLEAATVVTAEPASPTDRVRPAARRRSSLLLLAALLLIFAAGIALVLRPAPTNPAPGPATAAPAPAPLSASPPAPVPVEESRPASAPAPPRRAHPPRTATRPGTAEPSPPRADPGAGPRGANEAPIIE